MKKILIILAVLAVLIYLDFRTTGFVRYYILGEGIPPGYCDPGPCPDSSTEDWKTYRNDEYGFEIMYPSNYFETSKSENHLSLSSSKSCEDIWGSGGGNWPKDCLSYSTNVQKDKIIIESADGYEGAKKESINVAGLIAEKDISYDGMYDFMNQIQVQFQKNGNWYVHRITFHADNYQKANSLLNQIISTLKFTK